MIAKPGLDGHDRGAKVVAQALKEAGMEVVYSGLHRTIDQIVNIAVQEDVDVIGLSIMTGAHIPITQKLFQKIKQKGIADKMVLLEELSHPRMCKAERAGSGRGFSRWNPLLRRFSFYSQFQKRIGGNHGCSTLYQR